MITPRRSTIITLIIVSFIFILTTCVEQEKKRDPAAAPVKNIFFDEFAGSEKCAGCHRDVFKDHLKTGHFSTSQPATAKAIMGSFKQGSNKFFYSPDLAVAMEKRDSGFYQVVYYKGIEQKALKFDVIIGSGTRGQSFTYWEGNRLFQMPITYYTFANQWYNSPGFPSKVQIDRPITSRCLECHSTFAGVVSSEENRPEEFDRSRMLYGVGCEKCHGPGAKHVEFHSQNPDEKMGRYIINPAIFTRQQKLDMCALCHGGALKKTRPSFTFTAGDTLADYFRNDTLSAAAINFGNVDVHGNQYELLKASKCFRMSTNLTCNSCHNTHENERGKLAVFSQRCMTCHTDVHANFTSVSKIAVPALKTNCIDCHMPTGRSRAIVVFSSGSDIPTAALFRSHFITVYPDKSKSILDSLKNHTLK